ncbi:hypothetical protein ACKKBG_A33570 [Auxenochlorella protothecoides x Auxenochlorella symbiontica]
MDDTIIEDDARDSDHEGTCSSSGRASDDSDQDSKQGESSSRQATEPPEFFDPEADDKSEAWVSKLRGGRRSDAILSCPQCFTTLCLECQQHAYQHNQFRAMFVMNCRIDSEIVQQYSVEPGGKARRGKKRAMAEEGDADADPKMAGALDAETFNPVTCAACDCSVGVRSMADGTYHFVDVYASNS